MHILCIFVYICVCVCVCVCECLKWFRSYVEGRGYYVSIGEHKSQSSSMTCGVPQGSILAPLVFSLYMLPLSQIMRKNQIAYHSYADDTQIYLAWSPNDYSPINSICQCIDEINSWMCQNFLQLNWSHCIWKQRWSSQGECIPGL